MKNDTIEKNKKTEYKHPNTVWENIVKDIEIKIIKGDYQIADKVPSISDIAEIYDCGKSTAKKVLEKLYFEEILTKQKGVGYFVKPYTREKLKVKHHKTLMGILQNGIEFAHNMGIEEKSLGVIFTDIVKTIYSP